MSQEKVVEKPQQELIKTYGRSAEGNFGVIDTISVTHPYCIGPKHLEYNEGPYLSVENAEKNGVFCQQKIAGFGGGSEFCGKSIKEHETALLVECLKEATNDNSYGKELHKYLKKIIKNKHFKEKGFVGCSLLDRFSKK